MRLKGKLAIVTGAASGIGRTACELFAREGAHVVAGDKNGDGLAALVSQIRANGGRADAIEADLTAPEECKRIINEGARLLNGLDILWNNAGVIGPPGIEGLQPSDYELTMNVNVRAGLLSSAEAVAHMKARKGGSIIFTSSISGIVGSRRNVVYAASKYAIVGIVQSIAQTYARDNIRVNAICPGPTDTTMFPDAMGRGVPEAQAKINYAKYLDSIPLGRLAQPIEVAMAGLWLASDDSSYVTGIALPVDGGFTAG